MSRDQIQSMPATTFFRYLLACRRTRDLTVQLAYVYDERRARAERPVKVR